MVEPHHFVERAAARVEQDVGAAEKVQQMLARGRLPQIQHNRFLVPVVVPEEQRAFETRLVFEKRADPPRGVAFRRFDLHHLGAQAGQQQAGIFGALVGDFDDPEAGQHARTGIAHHLPWAGRGDLRHAVSPSGRGEAIDPRRGAAIKRPLFRG